MTQNYEISRETRDLPPAHFTIELNSYGKLFRPEKLEKFESGRFEAGNYKWRLVFYPNGNQQDDGDGHISLYLKIDRCNTFSDNWSVHVNYKLFVQDRKRNKFLAVQDAKGPIRRFDHNKDEWGFAKFLSHDSLNEYLVNDTLVLGAEVFVIVTTGKKERISILKNPDGATTHTWKIPNFSALDENPQFSQPFTVDERKWKLRLYPKGIGAGRGKYLALHLMLVDVLDPAPNRAVFAEFDLLLRDQKGSNNFKKQYSKWFSAQCYELGHKEFISLNDLYESYVVGDTLIIESQFLSISAVH